MSTNSKRIKVQLNPDESWPKPPVVYPDLIHEEHPRFSSWYVDVCAGVLAIILGYITLCAFFNL